MVWKFLYQMTPTQKSGSSYPHRPFTRSQAKFCAKEAARLNLIFDGKVLQIDLEQISNMKVRTMPESHGNGSSADIILVDSSDLNIEGLSTCSEPEDDVIKSGIEIKDEITSASEGHRVFSAEISDEPRLVSQTTVAKSGIHPLDIQTTARRSRLNSSPSENYRPSNAGLTAMDFDTSLLQTIYSKYGDIAKDCNFKSEEVRKSYLLGISGVVQKLLDTKFDDLNYDDFTEMYNIIKDAESEKFDVKWLRERLDEIEDSLKSKDKLARMEEAERAITLQQENLKNRAESNKLEIANLEIEIKALEEEQTVKRSKYDEAKAMADDINFLYHSCPKYVIDYLL